MLDTALSNMDVDLDVETLKEGLNIAPAEKNKKEDDEDIISTQFDLSFSSNGSTGMLNAKDVVETTAESYREWFIEKYNPNFASLDISFDDLEDYDYPDMRSYLEVAVRRISAFAEALAAKDSAFLSSVTKESFSSLQAKAEDIENTGLEALDSYTNIQLKQDIRDGLFRAMRRQPPWKYQRVFPAASSLPDTKNPRRSVSPFKWILVLHTFQRAFTRPGHVHERGPFFPYPAVQQLSEKYTGVQRVSPGDSQVRQRYGGGGLHPHIRRGQHVLHVQDEDRDRPLLHER